MKKLLLLVLFVPLISFSQNETRNNNGLQNLLKQAEKLVGNIDFNKKSVETSDSDTEKLIINLWKNYSKAFEYKDYNWNSTAQEREEERKASANADL